MKHNPTTTAPQCTQFTIGTTDWCQHRAQGSWTCGHIHLLRWTSQKTQRPQDGLRGHMEPAHAILDKWSVCLSLEHGNLHSLIQSEYPELEGIRIMKSHSWPCTEHPKSHHVSQCIVPMLLELWHELLVPIFTSPHPGPVTSLSC